MYTDADVDRGRENLRALKHLCQSFFSPVMDHGLGLDFVDLPPSSSYTHFSRLQRIDDSSTQADDLKSRETSWALWPPTGEGVMGGH